MQPILRLWFAVGAFLLATLSLQSQSDEGSSKAQEDFALAVATSHARTSLFVVGSKPFAIHAKVVSSLALHGTGQGTYENQWIDSQHWHRVIQFPDFQQTEMRNDAGHSWIAQSSDALPMRIAEMLRVVVIHVPSSTTASAIPVTETPMAGDQDLPITCYSTVAPTPTDGFPLRFRYCFEKASGLLVSQDMPLNTHIVYSNYIVFQGKHEFTHVRVTSGSLPVLDIDIQYSPLGQHALDSSVPDAAMHRSKNAESTPNPEELGKGSVEYRFSPPLPPGTPNGDKDKPVQVQFHVSADNTVLDACVEDAPTLAMGEAALQAVRKFTFTPLTVDGKPAGNRFYYSIWFRSGTDDPSSPRDVADEQPGSADAARPLDSQSGGIYRSKEPSFAFRYPAGFEQIPRGELEEEQRSRGGLHPGLDPGVKCQTLLFRAQRLHPGERIPEVVTIDDLAPACIFGLLDQKASETVALNTAHSLAIQLGDGTVSNAKQYMMNGRRFAVVSASGVKRGTLAEKTNALVVVTNIRDYVVVWTIVGPGDNLAQTLAACTLQIDEARESPLLPISESP